MKPNKRNGMAARQRRQEIAQSRRDRTEVWLTSTYEECMECANTKLRNQDCMTPHCMSLRGEQFKFYDEATDDYIQIKGSRMYAGVDY